MRSLAFLSTLLVLAVCAGPAAAVDLATIDRSIAKEAAYESKTPKYCLLVFGPDAKTRVWLVLDGDILHADRNANGDVTEKGETVKAAAPPAKVGAGGDQADFQVRTYVVGDIAEADGKTKHTNLTLHRYQFAKEQTFWHVNVHAKWIQAAGGFAWADKAKDAPIIHFNGPLTMQLNGNQSLSRGENKTELYVMVGSRGLGDHTFASLIHPSVPADVHPVAEIEFPSKESGGTPIKARFTLNQRC